VIYNPDDGGLALYNLEVDPAEQQDVQEMYPEVAEAMRSTLLDWLARLDQVGRDLPRAVPPREFDAGTW
jgi:BMFP domain-containing protein YqiC